MALLTMPTDCDDFIGVVHVDAFHPVSRPKYICRKRDGQMLLEHAEQADALLGFPVRINEGFFDELVEAVLAERATQPLGHGTPRPTLWV